MRNVLFSFTYVIYVCSTTQTQANHSNFKITYRFELCCKAVQLGRKRTWSLVTTLHYVVAALLHSITVQQTKRSPGAN